jgi:hypothetical protein
MLIVASGPARLRCVRLVRLFALECVPQALKFKNERRALRSNSVALLFVNPAPRGSIVMLRTACLFHDATLSATEA